MDHWDISKDVFTGLIQDMQAKVDENEQYNANSKDSILNVLPTEILEYICSYLTSTELYTLRRVCKKLKNAASTPKVLRLNPSTSFIPENLSEDICQPFFINLVSLCVNLANPASEDGEYDQQSPIALLNVIRTECGNLKTLRLNWGTMPADATLELLSERLTYLAIDGVTFKNATRFFGAGGGTSPPPLYRNLEELDLLSCGGFKDGSPFAEVPDNAFRNLRALRLTYLDNFANRDLLYLQRVLDRVTTLSLMGLEVDNEAFDTLCFSNLTVLNLQQCQVKDGWLSNLRNMPALEELHISDVSINDSCAKNTFKKLSKLKVLDIKQCLIGDRTMNEMGESLPNLERWEVHSAEDGHITDVGFMAIGRHDRLEYINFDRVRITDNGLRKIVTHCPALKELYVGSCNCGDDAMEPLAERLTQLTKLVLNATRITDVGLMSLSPRLGNLEEFRIDSWFVTAAAVSCVVPLMTSARQFSLSFGEPQCDISYYNDNEEFSSLNVTGPGVVADVVLQLLQRFANIRTLVLGNVTLGDTELTCMATTQKQMKILQLNQCTLQPECDVGMLVSPFECLEDLMVTQLNLTDDMLVKLFEKIGAAPKTLQRVTVENQNFPSEETVRKLLPLSTSLYSLQLYCQNFTIQLTVFYNEYDKSFTMCGDSGERFDNDTLVVVAENYKLMTNLNLDCTAVTDQGVALAAPILTLLTVLRIKSSTVSDETMRTIANHFPALTTLTMECEKITDEGLQALGTHLQSLEGLYVTKSSITDEGVKQVAPFLASIRYLDLYDNPKVSKETLQFMETEYPEVTHIVPPEPEQAEQEWAIGEPVVQQQEQEQPEEPQPDAAAVPAERVEDQQQQQQQQQEEPAAPEERQPSAAAVPEEPHPEVAAEPAEVPAAAAPEQSVVVPEEPAAVEEDHQEEEQQQDVVVSAQHSPPEAAAAAVTS